MQHRRRFRRPGQKRGWANPNAQLAAQSAKQAVRLDTPIDTRGDDRETLRMRIETASGRAIVDWSLVPRQGNLRQYRALHWHTCQPVMIDGKALGGGKDRIGREAIKLMPVYAGNLDEPQGYSARDEADAKAAHEGAVC